MSFTESPCERLLIQGAFYAVQALEVTVGAVNLVLLGLNMRDGLRMTGRLRRRPVKSLPALRTQS